MPACRQVRCLPPSSSSPWLPLSCVCLSMPLPSGLRHGRARDELIYQLNMEKGLSMFRISLLIPTMCLALSLVGIPAQGMAADKLSVLLEWFVNPDHAPLVVAREKGYFAEAGLDVDLIPPADPSAPPRLAAAKQAATAGH